ncbi:MAG: anti-sigma factor family protein [Acidimicrobiales bacterium]
MKILGRLIGTRKQMSCHQVGQVLQSYLDNELDDDAVRKVAAHLEDCRRCGLEAETYEALKASLQRGPVGLADEPVTRLRAFGERLARGEIDPDELFVP